MKYKLKDNQLHEEHRAHHLVNTGLAGLSLLILILYGVYRVFDLSLIRNVLGVYTFNAVLSTISLAHYMLINPRMREYSQAASTFVAIILFSFNIGAIILATGGFTSIAFPLWLGVVVISGLISLGFTVSLAVATTVYFGLLLIEQEGLRVENYLIQLLSTYLSAGFSYWMWRHQDASQQLQSDTQKLSRELSQEQLKSEILLQSIGDGVVVVDNQGQIQLINQAAEELTGWMGGDAVGIDRQLVMPLVNNEDLALEGSQDPFIQVRQSGENVRRDDVILKTKTDKKLNLSLIVSPIFNAEDEITGSIAVFRDISEKKALERQRDEFISTASHEMRTPVASIEGYLSLAMNPQVAKIDDNARQYLEKAHKALEHLGQLFKDLLSITKLEDGRLPNNPEVTKITNIIEDVIDEEKFRAEEKGLQLEFQPSQKQVGNEPMVEPLYYSYVDPERIREVITNLVSNAIKFTEDGYVRVTLEGDEGNIKVGIHDSGMGIAPEDVPHLFQKFYRIDSTETREIGGTGLGLYISRTIVEMYDGTIWAESELGEGSDFYFTLPRLSQAEIKEMQKKQEMQEKLQSAQQQATKAPQGN